MDLVYDIGSTETTIGLFAADELRAHWRLASSPSRTPDEAAMLLRQLLRDGGHDASQIGRLTLASVVPAVSLAMREASQLAFQREPVVIDARTPLPIRLDLDEPLGVGADRLVNATAAHLLFGRAALVVDLGTATTYDCVTRDGVFIGGAIAPGPRTGAERLAERTARLPRVELRAPERVIGRRTEACLQSGIFYGAVDAVDGLVARILAEWGADDVLVVATGGLAPLIGPHCRSVQRIEPFLTLHGLRLARLHVDRENPAAVGADSTVPER